MKRIITFLFVMLMVNFAIGQRNPLVYLGINKIEKPSSPKGTDEISGEIATVSYYIAGATVTLNFTITLNSPDYEYGDFVEMTFPTGITPLDGSPFIGEMGNPENLNGVNGQVISWGDNDNNFGGIQLDKPYEFWVEVAVDESVTGIQEIAYFVSGDEYGAPPNGFTGTVNLYELPDVPDLAPNATGYVAACYSVPLAQAVIVPEGSVYNFANDLTEATNFNLTIGSAYDENLPITLPLGYSQTEYFTFPAYTATETGTLTFTYTANASNDLNPDNGTFEKDIEVDSTILSFNNGDIIGSQNGGAPGIMFGNVFYVAAEDVLTAVSFYLLAPTVGDIVSAKVYAFDGIPGDLIASTMDVAITTQNTEYTAVFPEEVILPAGNYLICMVEGEHYINAGVTSTPFVDNSAWVYMQGQWINLGDFGYKQTYMIEGIFGEYTAPLFDIALETLIIPNYVLAGDVNISGVVRNLSGEELTSIDIEYTVNSGATVMESFTGLSVEPMGAFDFTFANPASLNEVGAYDIVVTISNANGMGPDDNPENDQSGAIVNVIEYIPEKMVVGEEGTGTWCGWCVRGIVYMDSMQMKFPDTWIGIAVHNNDPMTVDEYDANIAPLLGYAYPGALADRAIAVDPADLEAAYMERMSKISPAGITIENKTFNSTTGELSFTLTSDFVAQVSGYRFNAVLVENNVTGTGLGWDQANFYSGGGFGPMGGYENLPDPVPAEDMVYQHVARALLGDFWGVEGSLPETIYAGETHSYEFTTTISDEWDITNLEIIGMLINFNDAEIANGTKAELITGIPDISVLPNVTVFPNPAKDEVRISNIEKGNIYLYNINGQLVMEKQNVKGSCKLDISNIENGTYILKIISDDETITAKVNVIK